MSRKNLHTGWYMYCALQGQGTQGTRGTGDWHRTPQPPPQKQHRHDSLGEDEALDPQAKRLQLPLSVALF